MNLDNMARIIQLQIAKDCKFKPEIIYKSKPVRQKKLEYSISRLQEIYKTEYDIKYDIKRLIKFLSK